MQTDYYPSLFDRKKNKPEENTREREHKHEKSKMQLNTLYDEAVVPQKICKKNFVTIFGTNNIEFLEKKVRSLGYVRDIEYGRNYLNVMYDSEESSRRLLALNRQVFNGEILGVHRQKAVIDAGEDVFVKQKNIFAWLFEYLFGA